jgi:hypothetical protein
MAEIDIIRAVWSTPKGGAGVSTFYANSAVGAPVAKVRSFFEALKAALPTNVSVSYPSTGASIDDVSGATVGTWTETGNTTTTGTGAGAFTGQSGCCIVWHTGFYAGRREIKGKTFIVPVTGGMWDADGTFLPGALTIFNTAAALLTTGLTPMSVYSPTNHTSKPMVNSTITDRAMTLKSRSR